MDYNTDNQQCKNLVLRDETKKWLGYTLGFRIRRIACERLMNWKYPKRKDHLLNPHLTEPQSGRVTQTAKQLTSIRADFTVAPGNSCIDEIDWAELHAEENL